MSIAKGDDTKSVLLTTNCHSLLASSTACESHPGWGSGTCP